MNYDQLLNLKLIEDCPTTITSSAMAALSHAYAKNDIKVILHCIAASQHYIGLGDSKLRTQWLMTQVLKLDDRFNMFPIFKQTSLTYNFQQYNRG